MPATDGPGAAQTDTQQRRIVERQGLREAGHVRCPIRLMPAVAHRLAQIIVSRRVERVHEQHRALQIEHGVGHRQR